MREEKEGRKKEESKVKQTNKAKQHSTPMYIHVHVVKSNKCMPHLACMVLVGVYSSKKRKKTTKG